MPDLPTCTADPSPEMNYQWNYYLERDRPQDLAVDVSIMAQVNVYFAQLMVIFRKVMQALSA